MLQRQGLAMWMSSDGLLLALDVFLKGAVLFRVREIMRPGAQDRWLEFSSGFQAPERCWAMVTLFWGSQHH